MLALLYAPFVQPTTYNAYCIFSQVSTNDKAKCENILTKLKGTDTFTYVKSLEHIAESYTVETFGSPAQTDTCVIAYSESLTLTAGMFDFLMKTSDFTKKVRTYGCELKIDYKGTYSITAATSIPTFNSKFISGDLKSNYAGITAAEVKKLGLKVTIATTVTKFSLTDESTFPNVTLATGQSITEIELMKKLKDTVLVVNKQMLTFGSLQIDMTTYKDSKLELPASIVVHLENGPDADLTSLITIKSTVLIFDPSFTPTVKKIFTVDGTMTINVFYDPTTPLPFITGGTQQKVTQFCVSENADKVCSNAPAAEKKKPADIATLATHTALYFIGVVALPTITDLTTWKTKAVLIDCSLATSITQAITTGAAVVPVLSLELPMYQFKAPAPAHLLSETVTSTGNVNPMIIKNSDAGLVFSNAVGLYLTGTESGNLDFAMTSIGKTANDALSIQIDGKENTIVYEADAIKLNNFDLKYGAADQLKSLKFYVPANSALKVSKTPNGITPKTEVTTEVASIHFDNSFNSYSGGSFFTSDQAESLTTESSGGAPWLESSTLGKVEVIVKPSGGTTPKEPSSNGLPGWGIALIVIACVIVVAVIVVVVLQTTGIIHICGKKKVEV